MLVDQDVLIQQNTGVATVWLMSTIGARATARRITRKEIQGVSIPETCEVIKQPPQGASLTLRVSSNLLYGVAVVYRQKTDYLSSDAQTMRTKIQRDILSLKNTNKHLIEPPVIHIPTNFSASGAFFVKSSTSHSSSSEKAQVLFHDDPLFEINDGLLPSLDQLDFLLSQPTQPDQHHYEAKRKQQLRAHDLANNTISHVISQITSTEDEETALFSQRHGYPHTHAADILRDELDSASEPQFAFNDDGLLLDIGGVETSASGPAGVGTEYEYNMNEPDMDFDFDMNNGEDVNRVPITPVNGRSRSGSVVRPELEQVLEEIGDEDHHEDQQAQIGDMAIENTNKEKKKNTNKRKRMDGTIGVVIDDSISISTEELRHCRDDYLSLMDSKRKKTIANNKQMDTLVKLRSGMNNFLPSFANRFLQPHTRAIPSMEERRGRDPTRRTTGGIHDEDQEEDFVSGLLSRRRRSSSIETGRNMSSSRRNSHASISGVPLNFGDNGNRTPEPQKYNDNGNGDFFDYDFDDVFGNNNAGGDSTTAGNSTSSRKRSSGTPSGIQRFGPVAEGDEMNYDDFQMDGGEDLNRVPLDADEVAAQQNRHGNDRTHRAPDDTLEGDVPEGTQHYDKVTSRFLSFIEFRFEDEPQKDTMTFLELLGQEYFNESNDHSTDDPKKRAAVVGSFYSVLQLATHGQIEITKNHKSHNDHQSAWSLDGPDDIIIGLRA